MSQSTKSRFDRYERQMRLPEIGEAGQELLSRAKVLCVGAGGLGSPALLYLAAAGVGTLGIVDDDFVDESNLQRQVLFTTSDVGISKVVAAEKRLLELNPSVRVHAHRTRLSASNALEIFGAYDLVIDGTDNFPSKFLINDAAFKVGIPVIYGSIFKFEGQVAVFWGTHGPCYRCWYPGPPKSFIPNCNDAGVLGALAGMVGTTQVMEAIKMLLWRKEEQCLKPLLGRILLIDASSGTSNVVTLSKNPCCPVCSRAPSEIVLAEESAVCSRAFNVTLEEVKDLVGYSFVDVRDVHEWASGHIPGAVNIPLGQLAQNTTLSQSGSYILYCKSGMRSQAALEILLAKRFSRVKQLQGGLMNWPYRLESGP